MTKIKEKDIVYSNSPFWVLDCKEKGFEVYQDGITHATRRVIIGYSREEGLKRAKYWCDKKKEEFINKNN